MPRPPIERSVANVPRVTLFKPAGIPARDLEQLQLAVDELEAIRLVDLEGLSHEQAAEVMGVSRQTVGRVLERSRAKVAEALVAGKAILIGGGQYRVEPQQWRCFSCQTRWIAEPQTGHVAACPSCGSSDVGMCWGGGERCGRRWGFGGGQGRGRQGQGPHGRGCVDGGGGGRGVHGDRGRGPRPTEQSSQQ
jgi:uncharacterized protein